LEVDVQQGNFKILWLLPQVLILFLVKKWISPTRSKTAKIGKKTEGILGIKVNPSFILQPRKKNPPLNGYRKEVSTS
jgi:hypothetical protein